MKSVILILLVLVAQTRGAEMSEGVVKVVDGIEIPIVVHKPSAGSGKYPVVFHVHGGGWNGGTEKVVPPAAVNHQSKMLCDEMGIIFVGLGYRCKNQAGTFQLAMEDLHDSVKWFKKRADAYDADLTRIGFSGGSAGAPLSALMAQQIHECRLYVGMWGVYDFTKNEESLFPDEKSRLDYGLETDAKARAFSAYHQLRANPPATFLLHGGKDILTHPAQSRRFSQQILAKGGSSKVLIFPECNHNFLSPSYPAAFEKGILALADFYVSNFEISSLDRPSLKQALKKKTAGSYPVALLKKAMISGNWKSKSEVISIEAGGKVVKKGPGRKSQEGQWSINKGTLELVFGETTRHFFLKRDHRAIYEMLDTPRRSGMKVFYSR